MINRTNIDNKQNKDTFHSFHYLKEELVDFRENDRLRVPVVKSYV